MPYKNRAQQTAYQAGYLAGRRTLWLQEHGPCVGCGSWERLEVDHVDPSEKLTHRVWSLSKELRALELAKCQVLCNQCHKAKTRAATMKPLVHGTRNAYNKKRCRCNECRRAATDRVRQSREQAT